MPAPAVTVAGFLKIFENNMLGLVRIVFKMSDWPSVLRRQI